MSWRRLVVPYGFIGLFFLFSAAFMLAPAVMLAVQAVMDDDGGFTLAYLASLGEYRYRVAFENSMILSVASATVGVLAGGLIAQAVSVGAPGWVRSGVTSFSAVAANFAGVPLAFAFIATLGSLGLLTSLLKQMGVDLYGMGFSLYSLSGLTLVYSYFQIPLMVIIVSPAVAALKPSWREAADNLGATPAQYWRMVGLPVLLPALLSAWILLFGSAFSAYATAYALTSGNIGLVTTEISNVLSGNVMSSPQTGAALSAGMIVVMVGVLGLSAWLARRSARWTR